MYAIITVGILVLGFYLISKVKDSFSIEGDESENPLFPNVENPNTIDTSLSQFPETLDDEINLDSRPYSSANVEGPLSMPHQKMQPSFKTVENFPNKRTHSIKKDSPENNINSTSIHRQHPNNSLTLNSRQKLRQAIVWKEILDNKFITK